MGKVPLDYLMEPPPYTVCQVSESLGAFRGRPGLIKGDCQTMEEAERRLADVQRAEPDKHFGVAGPEGRFNRDQTLGWDSLAVKEVILSPEASGPEAEDASS
jgi:hypothetical protein